MKINRRLWLRLIWVFFITLGVFANEKNSRRQFPRKRKPHHPRKKHKVIYKTEAKADSFAEMSSAHSIVNASDHLDYAIGVSGREKKTVRQPRKRKPHRSRKRNQAIHEIEAKKDSFAKKIIKKGVVDAIDFPDYVFSYPSLSMPMAPPTPLPSSPPTLRMTSTAIPSIIASQTPTIRNTPVTMMTPTRLPSQRPNMFATQSPTWFSPQPQLFSTLPTVLPTIRTLLPSVIKTLLPSGTVTAAPLFLTSLPSNRQSNAQPQSFTAIPSITPSFQTQNPTGVETMLPSGAPSTVTVAPSTLTGAPSPSTLTGAPSAVTGAPSNAHSIVPTSSCVFLSTNTTEALANVILQANGTQTSLCSFSIVFEQQVSLDVPVNLICQGACILDGGNSTRLFSFGFNMSLQGKFEVIFQGFSFWRGRASSKNGDRNPNGGAFAFAGQLSSYAKFYNCTFLNNSADASGGAISSIGNGILEVDHSSFEGNVASHGGAIEGGVSVILTVQDSTFRNNTAFGGGRAGAAIAVDGQVNCAGNNIFEGNVGYPDILGPSVGCDKPVVEG